MISAILSGQEVDHSKKSVALEFIGLFGTTNAPDAYQVKIDVDNQFQLKCDVQTFFSSDPASLVGNVAKYTWTKIFGDDSSLE